MGSQPQDTPPHLHWEEETDRMQGFSEAKEPHRSPEKQGKHRERVGSKRCPLPISFAMLYVKALCKCSGEPLTPRQPCSPTLPISVL